MAEKRDPTTGLTPEEMDAALHFMSKGYKIVDFSTEPAHPDADDE